MRLQPVNKLRKTILKTLTVNVLSCNRHIRTNFSFLIIAHITFSIKSFAFILCIFYFNRLFCIDIRTAFEYNSVERIKQMCRSDAGAMCGL